MMEKMASFYSENIKKCLTVEAKQICVAKSYNAYYRVQLIEISADSVSFLFLKKIL
jgi:hypothetical protein